MGVIHGNSIRARLINGAKWSVLGSVLSQALALAGMAIAARILGPTKYGEVTLVQNTVLFAALMAAPSFGLTASRYLAEHLAINRRACGTLINTLLTLGLLVPVIFAIGLLVCCPLLAGRFAAIRLVSDHSYVFALLFILSAFNSVQLGILSGFEDFRGIAYANMAKGVLMLTLVPIGARFDGVSGAIEGLATATVFGVIVAAAVLELKRRRLNVPHELPNLKAARGPLVSFTLPAALSTAMTLPVMWWSNALLAQSQNGMHELGLFNAANQWRTGIVMMFSLMTAPLLPVLSNIFGNRDLKRFKQTVSKMIWTTGILGGLATLCTYILGVNIATTLFGQAFITAAPCFVLLTGSTIFSNISSVLGIALQATNQMWSALLLNLLWSAVFGSLCFALPTAMGIAWAFFVAYLLQAIACVAIFWRRRNSLHDFHTLPVPIS